MTGPCRLCPRAFQQERSPHKAAESGRACDMMSPLGSRYMARAIPSKSTAYSALFLLVALAVICSMFLSDETTTEVIACSRPGSSGLGKYCRVRRHRACTRRGGAEARSGPPSQRQDQLQGSRIEKGSE